MLNAEKYKKDIEKSNYCFAIANNEIINCFKLHTCADCKFDKTLNCGKERFKWLLQEYKEPILTDEGKTYLSNLLKPYGLSAYAFAFYFSKSINSKEIYWLNIVDSEHYPIITIKVNKNSELDKLFKNIELSKKYTLEELEL